MARFLFILMLLSCAADSAKAQLFDDLTISGYLQATPVWISAELPEPLEGDSFLEYRLQNRLNIEWYLMDELSLNWEMRSRFFAGDLVDEIPFYKEGVDTDPGFMKLSWIVADSEKWFVHYIPDRLNLDWNSDEWRITVGRQRINWGINMATNPNDLFNIYSFYDFDYPERPGTDAIRIQHFLNWASRIEIAYSPAREARNSVAAALFGFNTRGYDVQVISGYYRHKFAAGGGWAGSIGQSGFKGEVMGFFDLDEDSESEPVNLIAALSADYIFDNSLFVIVEGLYNKEGGRESFLLLGEPITADNPSFSRFQFTAQGSYPFTPVWNGSLAVVYYPDEEAVYISPSVSYSVGQNVDFNLITQIFAGSSDSAFSNAGNVVAATLKWNF